MIEQIWRQPLEAAEAGHRHDALIRPSEWILLAYFANTAALALIRSVPLQLQMLAVMMPVAVWWLASLETNNSRPWTSVARDWLPLGLVLIGYLQVNWFAGPSIESWQQTWLGLDRTILHGWGLRAMVESTGRLAPSILEGSYLLTYALPAICLGLVYRHGRVGRVDRFLQAFLLGTLGTYALLPHFPTVAPRLAFPDVDLPAVIVPLRTFNLWILGHFDITTSVFPSGHVTAAFASAFGLWRAIPERRWISGLAFLLAVLVMMATVDGRYHYAVDGLAGMAVSILAFLAVEAKSSAG